MSERIRRAGLVAWAVLGLAALLGLLLVVAWWVRVIWPPLIFAGAIVFLLNPIVSRMQHHHVPRLAGTALAYLGFFAIVVVAALVVVPVASDQLDELSEEFPEGEDRVRDWLDDRAEQTADFPIQVPSSQEFEDEFSGDSETIAERIDTARDLGLRVFHVLVIVLLSPILAFYLLIDLPRLRKVAESLVPARARDEVFLVAGRLNRAIGGFFRGQLVVAIIVGLMVSVGLAVIDLPFWFIVGMVAGVFNLVPLIGPWVGAIPGIIIALTTGDVRQAVLVALIMLGAQQIDNHFISPLVMQRAVKLHPAVVLLALLAGGSLFGFLGLLLAVPAAAVLKILVGHVWRTYVLGEPIEKEAAEWVASDAAPGVGVIESVTAGDDDDPIDDPIDDPEPEQTPSRLV